MNISTASNTSQTKYMIDGTRDEVEAEIDKLMRRWHPLGYGTHVSSSNLKCEAADVYIAVVTRANSCD